MDNCVPPPSPPTHTGLIQLLLLLVCAPSRQPFPQSCHLCSLCHGVWSLHRVPGQLQLSTVGPVGRAHNLSKLTVWCIYSGSGLSCRRLKCTRLDRTTSKDPGGPAQARGGSGARQSGPGPGRQGGGQAVVHAHHGEEPAPIARRRRRRLFLLLVTLPAARWRQDRLQRRPAQRPPAAASDDGVWHAAGRGMGRHAPPTSAAQCRQQLPYRC